MELRHLAAFVAVAEEGSFTRAADRLHIVQSAVSSAVRTLERELDARLLERTTKRVALTDAGRLALPEARRALAAAAATRDVVDELRGGLRGTVRLGIMQGQTDAAVSVPRVVGAFRREHPGVEVELHHGPTAAHADNLLAGRIELAYVGLRPGSNPDLEFTPLASHPMQLCCPADHPLAQRSAVTLRDLADEPFVELPVTWGARMAIDRAFERADVRRDSRYEVADAGTLVDFVHHGLAVAILPALVIDPRAHVRLVPIRRHAPVFTTSIAAAAGRELSAPAAALLDTARRVASTSPHPSGSSPRLDAKADHARLTASAPRPDRPAEAPPGDRE
jgi:DNA-binding transcriptional LysR family regulator